MKKILSLLLIFLLSIGSVQIIHAETKTIAFWGCEEGTGTTVTDSLTGLVGTLNNVSWQKAGNGSALSFDNSMASYVSFTKKVSVAISGTDQLTFAARIKPSLRDGATRYRIFNTYLGGVVGIEVYLSTNNRLVVGARSTASDNWQSKTYDFAYVDEWVHIAAEISYSNKTIRLFANGREVPAISGSPYVSFSSSTYQAANGSKPDTLGGDGATNNSFHGQMDDIALYRKSLSSVELKTLSNYDKVVGSWDMEDGSTSSMMDKRSRLSGSFTNVSKISNLYGSYLKFDNSALSYVSFPNSITSAISGADTVAFSAWINPVSKENFTRYRICNTYIGSVVGIEIYLLPNNRLVIGARSAASDTWQSKTYEFPYFDQWIHIAAEIGYTSKTIRLYLNSTEVMPITGTSSVTFGSNTYSPTAVVTDYIGGNGLSGNSFHGNMDDIVIYTRSLTADDLDYLFAKKSVLGKKHIVLKQNSSEFLVNGSRTFMQDETTKPMLIEDCVYLPAKYTLEGLGYQFEQVGETVTLTQGSDICSFTYGEQSITVNGTAVSLDNVFRLENGVGFLPLEVCRALGYSTFTTPYILICEGAVNIDDATQKYLNNCFYDAFRTSHFLEPYRDHVDSRTVVAYSNPSTGLYIGSPSLVRLDEDTLIASHDYFGKSISSYLERVYRSDDNGKTWRQISELTDLYWASMFRQGENLYLLGTSKPGGHIVIRKSTDSGYTWTVAANSKNGLLFEGNVSSSGWYHCGSVPVLKANGRIYKGFEDGSGSATLRDKKALVVSAPENCDLLNAVNWTMSNKLLFDKSWQPSNWITNDTIWIEGNMVKDKNGNLKNIIRLEANPTVDKAAILSVSADGSQISFDPSSGFLDFPGGMSLFNIKYDPAIDCYLALVDNVTDPNCPTQRNVLSLSYSTDLVNWKIAETVLSDNFSAHSWKDSMDLIGYQYVDWLLDGEDIIFLVREGNGSYNYHNANYLTFYRLKDYKKYIQSSVNTTFYNHYKNIDILENGEITAKVSFLQYTDEVNLYLCYYDEKGKLQDVKIQKVKAEPFKDEYISLNAFNTGNVKLFVWKDGLKPVYYSRICGDERE